MANTATAKSASINTPNPPSPAENGNILINPTPIQYNTESGSDLVQAQSEIEKLKLVLSQTTTKVAQKILREKWREFIFAYNDEDHISFLLRAILKNVETSILNKVFRDESLYKSRMFDFMSVKEQMVVRVLQNVNYEQLISLVPDDVLNKVLAERIKYVPARDLINWLASADRLGYKSDDILNDEDEYVVPCEINQVAPS